MTPTPDLLKRVREATGELPNDLLGEMLCRLEGVVYGSATISCGDDGSDELSVLSKSNRVVFRDYRERAPDVSIDAALALVERVRPGKAGVVTFGQAWSRCDFIGPSGVELHETCRTPALALLAALLSSLDQGQEGET